jgi:hypothetical protein
MAFRATTSRTRTHARELDPRRIEHDARRIGAVIHASSKLQRLRNRIAALELALRRIEHPSDAT